MEQQLKQRLVGVAVIFSLAVIFLPMLLDGSGNRSKHLKISIPTPPNISTYEIIDEKVAELKNKVEVLPQIQPSIVDDINDPPDTPEKIEQVKASETKAKSTENVKENKTLGVQPDTNQDIKNTAKTKSPVEVNKEPVKVPSGGTSWVIQVGSFSEKNKAYKLRDRLRKTGLAAVFIEKFKHDGVLSYRVRMGPFISRDEAKVIGNKVQAKYSVKGLVMRYEK